MVMSSSAFFAIILVICIVFVGNSHAQKTRLTKERIAYLMHTASRSSVQISNPGAGSSAMRAAALVNLAMFESVNAIEQKYEPWNVTFASIPSSIDLNRANKVAAAATAVRGVLDWLYPGNFNQGTRFFHKEMQDIMIQGIIGSRPQDIQHGIALGEFVAARLIANRTNDGWVNPPASLPVPQGDGVCAYAYNIPPYFPGQPFSSAYGFQVRAFGSPDPQYYVNNPVYYAPPPPACDSAANLADLENIFGYGTSYAQNSTLTYEKNVTAYFHGGYYGTFNDFGYEILTSSKSLGEADDVDVLRVLALASMAQHDTHASHWTWKYTYFHPRPITVFRMINASNPAHAALAHLYDPNWNMGIPAFMIQTPEYPSGHSSSASAYFEAFRLGFGDEHNFTLNSYSIIHMPEFASEVSRTYTRFTDVIEDVNDARVFVGVHYRNTVNVSTVRGKRIAGDYFDRLLKRID